MTFSCKRCGYETTLKCNLKGHLTKRKPCNPDLADIDRKVLFDEVNVIRLKCECEWCGKTFSSDQSKSTHKSKHCKRDPKVGADKDAIIDDLVERVEGFPNTKNQSNDLKWSDTLYNNIKTWMDDVHHNDKSAIVPLLEDMCFLILSSRREDSRS